VQETGRPGLEVSGSFTVDRDRASVYDFLTDSANFAVVDAAMVDHSPEGRLAEGTEGWMRRRVLGPMKVRTSWRVAALEPDRKITVDIRGAGYTMRESVELTDAGSGTEVRVLDSLTGTSLPGRLFVMASRGFVRRDIEARGRRTQAALERGGAPA
jgi:carbon monoxide dehydrogenase subunit G